MKVALVHDWLVSKGGGERVLCDMHKVFPDAPIYTLVYDPDNAPAWTKDCDIRTTYINKIPLSRKLYKVMLTMMPKAWEALNLSEFDLVISSCSSCSKGVITRPDALHICYCHSPIRYVWDMYYEYLRESGFIKRLFMKPMIHKMKIWDTVAVNRVDYFVANSYNIANRIKKFYKRDSDVIYPGCHINDYGISEEVGDYYLIVSRFVGYKRIDLAIEACNRLGRRLVVVGTGSDEKALKKMAGPTIEFKGYVSEEELQQLYLHAKAFLFPGDEDFGITPIEAQSTGLPVLAYGKGGALETVLDKKTGLFFNSQSVESLVECIMEFEKNGVEYDRAQIREHSLGFSEERFRIEFKQYCIEKYDAFLRDIRFHGSRG